MGLHGLHGLLLDLDGTLIQFQIDYSQCREKTIEILEENGYPKDELSIETFVLKMLGKATHYFEQTLRYSDTQINAIKSQVDGEIAKVEYQAALKAQPIPQMEKLLKYAQEKNLKTGIITLNTSKNALVSLNRANLQQYFTDETLIVGRDQTSNHKPHVDHAHTLLNRMHLTPEQVCVIGDHPSDIEVANNIGARSIAVVSPKHPREEFKTPYFVQQNNPYPKIIEILESFRIKSRE
ncbi:MAG: HAD family hydrolase [Promethearchaeota archaeon]|nr:MAG: HAD family hydrolase [Candidatus Lokiarchaeota archaeon]